jgi:hypothetical protein
MNATVNKISEVVMLVSLLAVMLVGACLDSPSYVPLMVEFFLCIPLGISVVTYNLSK